MLSFEELRYGLEEDNLEKKDWREIKAEEVDPEQKEKLDELKSQHINHHSWVYEHNDKTGETRLRGFQQSPDGKWDEVNRTLKPKLELRKGRVAATVLGLTAGLGAVGYGGYRMTHRDD